MGSYYCIALAMLGHLMRSLLTPDKIDKEFFLCHDKETFNFNKDVN